MKQIITRVDDELAEALKRKARQSGQSVNGYLNRLLRLAVVDTTAASNRQLQKAAALADGRLLSRPAPASQGKSEPVNVRTPAGYAGRLVTEERDSR